MNFDIDAGEPVPHGGTSNSNVHGYIHGICSYHFDNTGGVEEYF